MMALRDSVAKGSTVTAELAGGRPVRRGTESDIAERSCVSGASDVNPEKFNRSSLPTFAAFPYSREDTDAMDDFPAEPSRRRAS